MPRLTAAAIVDSTIGAGLLDLLEKAAVIGEVPGVGGDTPLDDTNPDSVAKAAALAAELPFGRLLKLAVLATGCCGSYWGLGRGVPTLQHRHARAPIAEAIAAREDSSRWFDSADVEQWWWTDGRTDLIPTLGTGLEQLAFWWATHPLRALMTTSPFPTEMLETGIEAPMDLVWDVCFGPRARWAFDVDEGARVLDIHGPDDWAALVRRYPLDGTEAYHNGHEYSPVNDRNDRDGLAALLAVPGQRAIRRGVRRFLTPDWVAVSNDWDGVHVSWAGYLLADGTMTDLGDGDVTMLRNWGSERTAWLAPVLRSPRRLPIPPKQHRDVRPPDDGRWKVERELLVRAVTPRDPV